MSIALAVAVITVMAVTIYLNITLNHHIADTNMEIEHLKFMYEFNQKLDDSIDKDLDKAEIKINAHQESIDEIISKLEKITQDIRRIDHDETELRRYYINFREPMKDNSGVEWANEIKCNEEKEDE